jgi:dGTPase
MNNTTFRMNWEKLLSDERQPLPGVTQKQSEIVLPLETDYFCRSEFQRDYDRVVFSTPFRRLARKTQVHPFAEMDQIHNRLTHTLEVASVGRSLGYAVGRLIIEKGKMPAKRDVSDIVYIVQAACLAHDIGNPPFGHAGEYAIREWARTNATDLFGTGMATSLQGIACDWINFEGNAQGFRMVSRSDNRDQLYFRFTYASLGAMLKYPWTAKDPRAQAKEKHGAFSSEEIIFQQVTESLGLRTVNGNVVRHPLSFLSEVADDICYRIGDFEDAVHMHILPESEVRTIFSRITGGDSGRPLPAMRASAINSLVRAAFEAFRVNYDSIMSGDRDPSRDLKSDFPEPQKSALIEIKEKYPEIFGHRQKVAVELGAYNILGRLLSVFARVARQLANCSDYSKLGFIDKRCVDLAWGEVYVKKHLGHPYEWWLARVMDFVSGMTDNYATQVASEIEGV